MANLTPDQHFARLDALARPRHPEEREPGAHPRAHSDTDAGIGAGAGSDRTRVPSGGPTGSPLERSLERPLERPLGGPSDDPAAGHEPASEPRSEPVLSGGERAERARDLLYEVIDPELGIDIVNLGLLRSLKIENGVADVRFTVTTPACPLSSYIEDEIDTSMRRVPGVKEVNVTCEYEPAWRPEDMSAFAREQLGWRAGE